MDIDELIEKARKTVFGPEYMKQLHSRISEMDKRFVEERENRESDPQGFLNRQYTI